MNNLGVLYEKGNGVNQSYEKAAELYDNKESSHHRPG